MTLVETGAESTASSTAAALSPALWTRWRWAILAACLGWLALVAAPALAAAGGWPAADLLRSLLAPACHQLPARSPHFFGEPLAACHRCVGLYLGFTLGIAAWPRLPALAHRVAARPRWIAICLLPLGIDWMLLDNNAASRFVTGLVASFPVALLALFGVAQLATSPEEGNQAEKKAEPQPRTKTENVENKSRRRSEP